MSGISTLNVRGLANKFHSQSVLIRNSGEVMKIQIDHIAKIEGHAGFTADISQGKISQVRLDILEGARLIEGILRDRPIGEVSQIASRICGVCPVVHNLTSLKALENALHVEVSQQTILLRKLMMMGQIINSHLLHLFFFSLSDFFGIKDDLRLVKKFPKKAQEGLIAREFGNKIIEVIGGRSIHPLTPVIGGFLKLPGEKDLAGILKQSETALQKSIGLAELFIKLKYPDFQRPAPFASLVDLKEYAFYGGSVKTPDNQNISIQKFLATVKEHQIQKSLVKRSDYFGKPFMVGAIARINHSRNQLNPEALGLLKKSKKRLPSFNPFDNIWAQAIETVHCVEETRKILKELIRKKIKPECPAFSLKNSEGWAAIEGPRGTLYYYYAVGKDGLVKDCNIITPTSQNLARLEQDLEEFLPQLAFDKKHIPKTEIENKIKMLVRAYDPCLTCATH
ncbi:MAG: Nickel-dependent hydrogenase [Parcubacteria group bacterium GW2011_GWC1_43_12]|nr:MAG: Nickel-dependent hydrogenase [Parcubacteria group bacterium GW2011_GWC1_43_12]